MAQSGADGFLPVRIPPESLNFFSSGTNRTNLKRLLWAARLPGGIERPFLSRLADTDPALTIYLWNRKSVLDEMGLLYYLLARPPLRGKWKNIGGSLEDPSEPPHPLSGFAHRLNSHGTLRNYLRGIVESDGDATPQTQPAPNADSTNAETPAPTLMERVLVADTTSHRGRSEDLTLPADMMEHSTLRLIPLSMSGDFLCRDRFGRTDIFVHAAKSIHPPTSATDYPHFSHQCKLEIQKGMPVLATHLIAIALFELRLQHKPFRFEKIESRLHSLAKHICKLDFPYDARLKSAAFRSSRVERFKRLYQDWFYQVDGKYYFKTEEFPEIVGKDLLSYFWYADQAYHVFYDLGLNKTELDQFIVRHKK